MEPLRSYEELSVLAGGYGGSRGPLGKMKDCWGGTSELLGAIKSCKNLSEPLVITGGPWSHAEFQGYLGSL